MSYKHTCVIAERLLCHTSTHMCYHREAAVSFKHTHVLSPRGCCVIQAHTCVITERLLYHTSTHMCYHREAAVSYKHTHVLSPRGCCVNQAHTCVITKRLLCHTSTHMCYHREAAVSYRNRSFYKPTKTLENVFPRAHTGPFSRRLRLSSHLVVFFSRSSILFTNNVYTPIH